MARMYKTMVSINTNPEMINIIQAVMEDNKIVPHSENCMFGIIQLKVNFGELNELFLIKSFYDLIDNEPMSNEQQNAFINWANRNENGWNFVPLT